MREELQEGEREKERGTEKVISDRDLQYTDKDMHAIGLVSFLHVVADY